MPWYTYILLCHDNSYYTGITNNLEKRVKLHNDKKGAKSLRGKLPVKLIYHEEYPNKSEAGKREIEIKGWPRKKKELLVNR
jgi:predicted GIY-YIG superfamily endonuclease